MCINENANFKIEPFIDLIKSALSNVDQKYWEIWTANNQQLIRERAFCYELYHQMRKLQETACTESDITAVDITGEIYKAGYEGLATDEKKSPDFIFHTMRTHSYNTIVMEVKGQTTGSYENGIEKDFTTINSFMSSETLHYKYGIFLLFGHKKSDLDKVINNKKINVSSPERVFVIVQESQDSEAEVRKLSDIVGGKNGDIDCQ